MPWPFPVTFMLCDEKNLDHEAVNRLAVSGQWTAQRKWDGVRAQVHYSEGTACIVSRTGQDLTRAFPEITKAFEKNGNLGDFGLDGELVSYDGCFDTVARRANTSGGVIGSQEPCFFVCFDVVEYRGLRVHHEGVTAPYAIRAIWRFDIEQHLGESPYYHFVEDLSLKAHGMPIYDKMREDPMVEGLVLKNITSPYIKGRSNNWKKAKFEYSFTAIVIDIDPTSLTMTYGLFDRNMDLKEVGSTTSGTSKDWLHFHEGRKIMQQPTLVEIVCNGVLESGHIRHARAKGRRMDILMKDCTMDQLEDLPIR